MRRSKLLTLLLIPCLLLTLTACDKKESSKSESAQKPAAAQVELMGAGASFPHPFYSKLFDTYHKKTGVKINYQAIGSGGGIRQLQSKTVDFGATDAYLKDSALADMPAPVLHIPMSLGAVCLAYNLPGNIKINLTGDVVAQMFLGKIKKWNDPAIKALNPNVSLPSLDVLPVRRSDGSGTTYIFTDYLSKVSPEWESKMGRGKSLDWPVGIGGKGNSAVAGLVKQVPGSIGYLTLSYAVKNNLPCAALKNSSGNYIEPSMASTSTAADIQLPADSRVLITNTNAADGYPISGFTWIIVYEDFKHNANMTEKKAKAVKELLTWMVNDGQNLAEKLYYPKLPKAAQENALNTLAKLKFNGKAL